MNLPEIVNDFVSLFFPRCCLACSQALVKGEESICTSCMLELPQTQYHRDPANPLRTRMSDRVPIAYGFAFLKFTKSGRVQKLLHALKYKNHPEVGILIGKVYGDRLKEAGLQNSFDGIVPVPLHPSRLRKRGYNQSERFAEGLSLAFGVPNLSNALSRSTKTQTQTRKTKLKRWENVAEVFVINDQHSVRGLRILLVDDVVTTGATLEACITTLLAEGCTSVSIACIAEA